MPLERDCVSCGKTLKITEWGVDRKCPYCGQDTVKVDIKEIHVSFSRTHETSWRDFLSNAELNNVLGRADKYSVGLDYERIRLCYELCYGDISNPPYSNANYYAHHSCPASAAVDGIEWRRNQLANWDKSIPVYLWLSDNDANGFMNFLYFAKEFKEFQNVFWVQWNHTEKDYDSTIDSMIESIYRKTKLTPSEMDDFYARFKEIQGWKAECLVGNSDHVEPCTLEKLEKYVISCLNKEDYYAFGSIFMDVIAAFEKDTTYRLSYDIIMEVVHQLMLVGKIESHGACEWWGEGCYNNMISTQSFRIADKTSRSFTYSDALEAIADAFEYGYTYPLYDLLAENTTLAWEEELIVGRVPVIEHIENIGALRVHNQKQTVECAITKVTDGTNYQIGEKFILLIYNKDDSKEHWLIKVLFDGIHVTALELSKPKGKLSLEAVED